MVAAGLTLNRGVVADASGVNWSRYLSDFHDRRAGITEALLSRTADSAGITPYQWVTDGLPDALCVDLGCGSGPTAALVPGVWVGIDQSSGELAAARRRGARPAVAGNAEQLPIRDRTVGSALAVMSLMVVEDPYSAATELGRILLPGGVLRVLVPSVGPLTAADRIRYGLLLAAIGLRAMPFPSPSAIHDPGRILEGAGFEVIDDQRRRFRFRLATPTDSELFLDSLYVPGVSARRLRVARATLSPGQRSEIGVPLRRLTAVMRPAAV